MEDWMIRLIRSAYEAGLINGVMAGQDPMQSTENNLATRNRLLSKHSIDSFMIRFLAQVADQDQKSK